MSRSFDSTTGEQTWITPPGLLKSLGHFDLDPCAADDMPYRTADRMVTKDEGGLSFDWRDARVWLNPPYGKAISDFLAKMHRGIALLPSRTDNAWFHGLVVPRCDSILFVRKRIQFISKTGAVVGTPAFASILVAYTPEDTDALRKSGIDGALARFR